MTEKQFKGKATAIFQVAENEGVTLKGMEVASEIIKKSTPAVIRVLQNSPLDSKVEVIDFLLKVNRTHGILDIPTGKRSSTQPQESTPGRNAVEDAFQRAK